MFWLVFTIWELPEPVEVTLIHHRHSHSVSKPSRPALLTLVQSVQKVRHDCDAEGYIVFPDTLQIILWPFTSSLMSQIVVTSKDFTQAALILMHQTKHPNDVT